MLVPKTTENEKSLWNRRISNVPLPRKRCIEQVGRAQVVRHGKPSIVKVSSLQYSVSKTTVGRGIDYCGLRVLDPTSHLIVPFDPARC